MKARTSLNVALLLIAVSAIVPSAYGSGPYVHVVGAGASAIFQGLEVAVVNDIAPTVAACANGVESATVAAGPGVCTIHHYSIKTSDCATCAGLVDSRTPSSPPNPAIQYGNIWVVWVEPSVAPFNSTDVWSDISIDATVGVRAILARGSNPNGGAVTITLAPGTSVTGATDSSDNAGSPSLMLYGSGSNGGTGYNGSGCGGVKPGCDDQYIANDVYAALNTNQLTAGLSEIRPEDARYATKRLNKPLDPSNYFAGLCNTAVGTCGGGIAVGQSILSGTGTSTAFAQPVNFGLPGFTDPISSIAVPSTFTTVPVGESPILVLTNRQDTTGGLGTLDPNGHPYYNGLWASVLNSPNLSSTTDPGYVTKLGKLFEGKDCTTSAAGFSNAGVLVPDPPTAGWGSLSTIQVSKIIVPGLGGPGTIDFKVVNGLADNFNGLVDGQAVFISGSLAAGAGYNYDGPYIVTGIGNDGTSPVDGTGRIEATSYGAQIPGEPAFAPFTVNPAGATYVLTSNLTVPFWTLPANDIPLTVIIREALSGNYNTFEWSSVRIFGGPAGSNDPNNSALSGKSQDANYTSSAATTAAVLPAQVKALACWYPGRDGVTTGFRTRAIGVSEVVTGAGGGGIQNTTDSIGYANFSFSNVSKIAGSANYGYLTIDGIDPIFTSYSGSGGEPGQPAANGKEWGELPSCNAAKDGTTGQGCLATDVWGASGNTFPNLRNGTYRSWAVLRIICDTAQPSCKNTNVSISGATFAGGSVTYTYALNTGSPLAVGESIIVTGMTNAGNNGTFSISALGSGTFTVTDAAGVTESGSSGTGLYVFGAEGLVANVQDDIHNGRSVADFLPFSEDGSFCTGGATPGTPCNGDASYIRSHFVPQDEYENEYAGSTVAFNNYNPGQTNTDTPQLSIETGGDVGGCIIPVAGEGAPAAGNTYTAPSSTVPGALSGNPAIPVAGSNPALAGTGSLQCHQ